MLSDDVNLIKGVGEKTKYYLNKCDIYTLNDLLTTLPTRYIVYKLTNLSDITEDTLVSIKAKVLNMPLLRKIRGNLTSLIFNIDHYGLKLKALIFGQDYLKYKLKTNLTVIFYGMYKPNKKEFIIRECFFDEFQEKIANIYPIKDISSNTIIKFIDSIYKSHNISFIDDIPLNLLSKYRLLDYNQYIYKSHFPSSTVDVIEITRRRKYEMYLKYLIGLNALRYYLDINKKENKIFDINKINDLISNLEYNLTEDQVKSIKEILSDLSSNKIMNRLVQGDVGSGKSIVALIAAYATILSGYQVALMVPSEVLSKQHYLNFKKILDNYNISIEYLTSSTKKKDKDRIVSDLKNGKVDLVIGTQSLLEKQIEFFKLGLVIIDEQHRFGVNERSMLISKGYECDSLFLTATPIPRTLGISQFGDLDISSIYQKPKGRENVLTKVLSIDDDEFVINAIIKNVKRGHQVFVVVPVINESDESSLINIYDKYEDFKRRLPDIEFGMLHGDMNDVKKEMVMNDFKEGKISCLISTTVIEVGIDIKNATLMVIYNAERFGLSTLHQLRGRVGRNSLKCGCLLLTNNTMCERLKILEECHDCFLLSEYDLKLRGPGDILGNKQSGFLTVDLKSDMKIYECAKKDAQELYQAYLTGKKEKIVEDIINDINSEKIRLN